MEGRWSEADFHRDLTKAKVHLNTPVRQRITIRGYISKVLIILYQQLEIEGFPNSPKLLYKATNVLCT